MLIVIKVLMSVLLFMAGCGSVMNIGRKRKPITHGNALGDLLIFLAIIVLMFVH